MVDGSQLRRGKHAANIVFGNPATVLVGDFLFSRSFELMVEDGSLKVLKILSHASNIIAEGEVNQLSAQRQVETSGESEIASAEIGEMVMNGLKGVDPVAYIRFASVYKDFTEARHFEEFAGSVKE